MAASTTSPPPNYITPEGLNKLKEEYRQLFHDERPKLVETVAWAASNGDRSENGDYIYGKRRLRQIDSRLRFLGKRIENAEVIDPTQVRETKIVFGATVHLLDLDDETHIWQIVGEDESDPQNGKVSWKSPIARSLMGKVEGDEVVIRRPKGDLEVEVVKIEYV